MDTKQLFNERLLTFKEAAEKLNVSFWFLYRRRGELPVVRLGPRTVRLRESDVIAWQNAHVIASVLVNNTNGLRAERKERERATGLIPSADLSQETNEPEAAA